MSGASIAAIAWLVPGQAAAQCTPDPSQVGQAVVCDGTINGGYVLSTSNSPLTLTDGSTWQASGNALTVSVQSQTPFDYRTALITVSGAMASSGGNGIQFQSGTPFGGSFDFVGTYGSIRIDSGASLSGVTGIMLARSPGTGTGSMAAGVAVDNSGAIIGTGGVALAVAGAGQAYSSITNRLGGTIGAINAPFGSLDNAGTIDGTSHSAVSWNGFGFSTIYNTGTIRSNSTDATVAVPTAWITNSGTIVNTGTGAAITGASSVSNLAGGSVTSNGALAITGQNMTITNGGTIVAAASGAAISDSGRLGLVNTGLVTGSVAAAQGSLIDSSQGTINGSLTLAGNDNTLVATLYNGALRTGIGGAIVASGSNNKVQVVTGADTTLANPLAAPAGFGSLSFAPGSGTTLTLADGFSSSGKILFDGSGTLTNATTLSGTGTLVAGGFSAGRLVNTGTIASANASGPAALTLTGYSILTNSGRITATGDGLGDAAGLDNSGTIIAGGTAVKVFTLSSSFTNTGSIISTGGTAVSLQQSCTCFTTTNSGTIDGAQVGLALGDGGIVNSGTITSPGYGIALQYYGTVQNQAGGLIHGGTMAIGSLSGSPGISSVSNAGTIEGDVNLANAGFSTNAYVALPGGVLNGNLALGKGDLLVIEATGSGAGRFAGITGTVSANQSNLIYNVRTDATLASTAAPTGFSSVGYQLFDQAKLTLTSSATQIGTLTLAGNGTVVTAATVAASNAAALLSGQTQYTTTSNPTALAITNSGTLSTLRTDPNTYIAAAVYLSSADTLVNSGTIRWQDNTASPYVYSAAVAGGASITNSGSITAIGANGVNLGASYGTATQSLGNSGTISGTTAAVSFFGAGTVTNSGTLSNSGGAAIASVANTYNANMIVKNLAGGAINGLGDAIVLPGGTVDNAGTINGNVNLGQTNGGYYFSPPGVFIARGGTVNGNLVFGGTYGGNQLIETGGGFGVTGSITAGPGPNYLGHLRTASGSVTLGSSLPAGFASEFVVASGGATQVTVTGTVAPGADIVVTGDGSLINQVDTTGGLGNASVNGIYGSALQLASLVNQARVGRISLLGNALANSGSVGSASATGPAVLQTANGTFSFANSGTIKASTAAPYYFYQPYYGYAPAGAVALYANLSGNGSIDNSGAITGGVTAAFAVMADAATAPTVTLTNSGTIAGGDRSPWPFPYRTPAVSLSSQVYYPAPTVGLDLAVINSGRIDGDIVFGRANSSLVNTSSGAISGNIVFAQPYYMAPVGRSSANLAGAFAGSITGSGITTVAVSGGSSGAPIAFGALTGIADYRQSGGFATIAGQAEVGRITVDGGRLLGLIGSTIASPAIVVGSNGTFGSGGTVNAAITVNGTLRPGASPDAMTVNGSVTLASGSTLAFEVTPTAHSTLAVTGSLTIAPGATLRFLPTGRVIPGTTLDLISASGGVTGSFASLTGMGAKLIEQNGHLAVLTLFDPARATTGQVGRGVAYLNAALASGTPAPALSAAIPALVAADGAPDPLAFSRMTAEPYASATQIGVETALGLADSARRILSDPDRAAEGVFSFGEVLSSWSEFAPRAISGTSGAEQNGYGLLGGMGVRGPGFAIAAFGGDSRQTQTIAALGASTRARGFVGGLSARVQARRFDLALTVAYDGARAATRRALPDATVGAASYGLHSWIADGQVSLPWALGPGWLARPHLGMTWVWTDRGAAVEAPVGPFASAVAGNRHRAGFVDGGMAFAPAPASAARLQPYLDLGLRWQIEGRSGFATSGFGGLPIGLEAAGARRATISALGGAGARYRLTQMVGLFVSGAGQLATGSQSWRVQAGLSARF